MLGHFVPERKAKSVSEILRREGGVSFRRRKRETGGYDTNRSYKPDPGTFLTRVIRSRGRLKGHAQTHQIPPTKKKKKKQPEKKKKKNNQTKTNPRSPLFQQWFLCTMKGKKLETSSGALVDWGRGSPNRKEIREDGDQEFLKAGETSSVANWECP